MKKLMLINFLVLCTFFGPASFADEAAPSSMENTFCAIDSETYEDRDVWYCKDPATNSIHTEEVFPILSHGVQVALEERGGRVVSFEEFAVHAKPEELEQLGLSPSGDENLCPMEVYYRVDEFNGLPQNHRVVNQLRRLATALHQAGVCDLPVQRQNFNNINIQTSQDVLHHFLCISNSESVFGTRNIGQGGRGPWGIHPMHNQRAGTTAFVDGRTTTLRRDGLCYPSQAVVRDSDGREIRESDRYLNENVILDNARCALTLYRQNGFGDWGRGRSWGSNRHCSESTRDRLQFFKNIGALGCCTDECRARYNDI